MRINSLRNKNTLSTWSRPSHPFRSSPKNFQLQIWQYALSRESYILPIRSERRKALFPTQPYVAEDQSSLFWSVSPFPNLRGLRFVFITKYSRPRYRPCLKNVALACKYAHEAFRTRFVRMRLMCKDDRYSGVKFHACGSDEMLLRMQMSPRSANNHGSEHLRFIHFDYQNDLLYFDMYHLTFGLKSFCQIYPSSAATLVTIALPFDAAYTLPHLKSESLRKLSRSKEVIIILGHNLRSRTSSMTEALLCMTPHERTLPHSINIYEHRNNMKRI